MARPSIAVAKVKELLLTKPDATVAEVHAHLGTGSRHRAKLVLDVAKGLRPSVKITKKKAKKKAPQQLKLNFDALPPEPKQWSPGGLPLEPKQSPDKRQETNSIGEILDARGKQYGTFVTHAFITQKLKSLMIEHANSHNVTLEVDQQEALEMIAHKIGRIVNGNPNYVDSWADIAGYAQLVVDRLNGRIR